MGYLAFTRKVAGPIFVLLWNLAGLCTLGIVVFIVISHAYFPGLWGDSFSLKDFAIFPYTLLAGFLMPVAVFLHIFSIVKTRRQMKGVQAS
jgi:hypothetical protein